MDDDQLIELLDEGQPEAVEALYQEYWNRIYSVVRPNVDNDWDAEEVTQDVIWTVFQKIDTFRGDSALWSWMYRIAVNEAKMKTRQYKRRPVPLEDDTLQALVDEEKSEERTRRPDEQIELEDVVEHLQEYLEDSKETNRQIYLEMEFGGSSKEELAEQFDLSASAIKARLHRMRVGLRERIRDEYFEEREL
jgi:RNA polymerase sigma-70 factor (ECF subfamily)